MRLVVEADDDKDAVRFYRGLLSGIPEALLVTPEVARGWRKKERICRSRPGQVAVVFATLFFSAAQIHSAIGRQPFPAAIIVRSSRPARRRCPEITGPRLPSRRTAPQLHVRTRILAQQERMVASWQHPRRHSDDNTHASAARHAPAGIKAVTCSFLNQLVIFMPPASSIATGGSLQRRRAQIPAVPVPEPAATPIMTSRLSCHDRAGAAPEDPWRRDQRVPPSQMYDSLKPAGQTGYGILRCYRLRRSLRKDSSPSS
jgi:hypothetical protein